MSDIVIVSAARTPVGSFNGSTDYSIAFKDLDKAGPEGRSFHTTGGWIDLQAGVLYRRPDDARDTKKRRPPIPIPQRRMKSRRVKNWSSRRGA